MFFLESTKPHHETLKPFCLASASKSISQLFEDVGTSAYSKCVNPLYENNHAHASSPCSTRWNRHIRTLRYGLSSPSLSKNPAIPIANKLFMPIPNPARIN